jgi:hypothetical protein
VAAGKIHVDRNQRASLRLPTVTAHFETVREALDLCQHLRREHREQAVLALESGRVYQPFEIELLTLKPPASE